MDAPLYIREDLIIPAGELRFSAHRASGPGGQHVNTTSSAVLLEWDVDNAASLTEAQRARLKEKLRTRISQEGILRVVVDTERSQHRNLASARERLVALVRAALAVPKKRVPTKISAAAKRRRLAEKRRRADLKRTRTRFESD